jgi:hypothetical protein
MSEDKRMRALFEALADNLDSMSDEQIVEECREGGRSPREVAQHTRAVLRSAVKSFKQRALAKSQAEHAASVEKLIALRPIFPPEPHQRRLMLATVLQNQPDARGVLTAQWRNFDEMTDTDVETALVELVHLGLIGTDHSE